MNIYNKGERTFNPGSKNQVKPGVWTEVPDDLGNKLLKLFPKEITTIQVPPTQPSAETLALKAKMEEQEKEIAKLRAQVQGLQSIVPAPSAASTITATDEAPRAKTKVKL